MAKNTWRVRGRSYDRDTGIPSGNARQETIQSDNLLFVKCRNIVDVKTAYEAFWNDLNPDSGDVVFVSSVTKLF